jgi:hypothetical protein
VPVRERLSAVRFDEVQRKPDRLRPKVLAREASFLHFRVSELRRKVIDLAKIFDRVVHDGAG